MGAPLKLKDTQRQRTPLRVRPLSNNGKKLGGRDEKELERNWKPCRPAVSSSRSPAPTRRIEQRQRPAWDVWEAGPRKNPPDRIQHSRSVGHLASGLGVCPNSDRSGPVKTASEYDSSFRDPTPQKLKPEELPTAGKASGFYERMRKSASPRRPPPVQICPYGARCPHPVCTYSHPRDHSRTSSQSSDDPESPRDQQAAPLSPVGYLRHPAKRVVVGSPEPGHHTMELSPSSIATTPRRMKHCETLQLPAESPDSFSGRESVDAETPSPDTPYVDAVEARVLLSSRDASFEKFAVLWERWAQATSMALQHGRHIPPPPAVPPPPLQGDVPPHIAARLSAAATFAAAFLSKSPPPELQRSSGHYQEGLGHLQQLVKAYGSPTHVSLERPRQHGVPMWTPPDTVESSPAVSEAPLSTVQKQAVTPQHTPRSSALPAESSPCLAPTCTCGNTFMPDALYCRKCGRRRGSELRASEHDRRDSTIGMKMPQELQRLQAELRKSEAGRLELMDELRHFEENKFFDARRHLPEAGVFVGGRLPQHPSSSSENRGCLAEDDARGSISKNGARSQHAPHVASGTALEPNRQQRKSSGAISSMPSSQPKRGSHPGHGDRSHPEAAKERQSPRGSQREAATQASERVLSTTARHDSEIVAQKQSRQDLQSPQHMSADAAPDVADMLQLLSLHGEHKHVREGAVAALRRCPPPGWRDQPDVASDDDFSDDNRSPSFGRNPRVFSPTTPESDAGGRLRSPKDRVPGGHMPRVSPGQNISQERRAFSHMQMRGRGLEFSDEDTPDIVGSIEAFGRGLDLDSLSSESSDSSEDLLLSSRGNTHGKFKSNSGVMTALRRFDEEILGLCTALGSRRPVQRSRRGEVTKQNTAMKTIGRADKVSDCRDDVSQRRRMRKHEDSSPDPPGRPQGGSDKGDELQSKQLSGCSDDSLNRIPASSVRRRQQANASSDESPTRYETTAGIIIDDHDESRGRIAGSDYDEFPGDSPKQTGSILKRTCAAETTLSSGDAQGVDYGELKSSADSEPLNLSTAQASPAVSRRSSREGSDSAGTQRPSQMPASQNPARSLDEDDDYDEIRLGSSVRQNVRLPRENPRAVSDQLAAARAAEKRRKQIWDRSYGDVG